MPCIDYFLFQGDLPQPEPYGTGRGELVRLYFALIGEPTHLFVVGVDAPNEELFDTLTGDVPHILATLQLPSELPPAS